MTKIDLGQTINILANVGVIVGLAFLVYELHQNNEFLEQQERYTFLENVVGFTEFSAADPDVARLIVRSADSGPLSELDQFRRCQISLNVLYKWQWEFDNLEITADGPIANAWRSFWRISKFDDCWQLQEAAVFPEFAQFLNTNIINR